MTRFPIVFQLRKTLVDFGRHGALLSIYFPCYWFDSRRTLTLRKATKEIRGLWSKERTREQSRGGECTPVLFNQSAFSTQLQLFHFSGGPMISFTIDFYVVEIIISLISIISLFNSLLNKITQKRNSIIHISCVFHTLRFLRLSFFKFSIKNKYVQDSCTMK